MSQSFVPALTCGNYTCRKLTVDLGFAKAGTKYFPKAAGAHTVELTRNYAGNETRKTFDWRVR